MNFPRALRARIGNGLGEAGLLLVLPLVFHRSFVEQFSTPKFFLTKCLIITGLAVWAVDALRRPASRLRGFPLGWPLLTFGLAVLVSCHNSPAPRFSLQDAGFALCGPVWVLLLVSWERGESAVHRIATWTGAAGALVAGIVWLQRLGYDPVLLGGYRVNWGTMVERMRLYSTLGNPNFVGGYLIGAIFPALALAAGLRARWARALWLGLAAVMAGAIAETGSRGAWFGLAVGLAVALAIALRKGPPRAQVRQPEGRAGSKTPRCVAPAWGWPVALLTLTLAERLVSQFRGRLYLWRFSWPIFWEHPILGSGWGTYQLLYLEFQGRFLAAHPEYAVNWTNNRLLHNDPMQLLLETGLLGFGAFVWILWTYGREAGRVLRQTAGAGTRYGIAASAGGITAILMDSLFNFQFEVPPTFILLFTLLAVPTMLHGAEVEEKGEGQPAPTLPARRSPWLLAVKLACSLAILAAAGGLLWQQTRVLASERTYRSATVSEHAGDLAGAETAYRRSVELNPSNGRAHFGLSRVYYMAQRFSEALEEVVRAERTYTDSHQEVLRARILEQMDRGDDALAAYRHAVWLDPTLTSIQADIERLSNPR
jgi:O-antigen ligase